MFEKLALCTLFDGMTPEATKNLLALANYEIREFAPGEVALLKGNPCRALMVLLSGRLQAERSGKRGRDTPVEQFSSGMLIAPGLLYAGTNLFPAHIVVAEPSEILFVTKDDFSDMLQRDKRVLARFLAVLSDSNRLLSDRMVYFGFRTIRGKYAGYLLEQSRATGSPSFRIGATQREMAERFGVTRPALARVVGELNAEGIIYVKGKEVTIHYPEKLKQYR
ncbi:MAG: Crp/Fnr family transcriptional regulator [Rikenellaceae bacterium]|jgi:CRP-like cAMP-binding protein|nr:Crp/Fnr family transcriptional regulator [Rikenellaceae bacterium]